MHIALNGWFWNQPYTGSGQYLRNLLNTLIRLDENLTVTLIVPAHVEKPDNIPESVQVRYAPTRLKGHPGKVWFEQRSFPALVKQSGADIAHVPYWGAPLSSPVPLVVSVLDLIPLVLPEYRGGFLTKLYTSLAVAGAKGASHILTLSEASKRDIVEHLQISPEQITPTLLAAESRYTHVADEKQDEAVRKKYNLPDEFALYLGGFDIRKNVHTLLLAWTYAGQALTEFVPLVLAGRMPKWGATPRFPDLPAYAKKLDIEKYIHWTGEIDEADKPSLYRLAKVMVWPSRYEGFGLPPLEAMACGTPVVACNTSSTPEVVGEAAYLVDPDNARDMAGAILALIVQDEFRQTMSNLAKDQATRFSWRNTAHDTLKVYQNLVQS